MLVKQEKYFYIDISSDSYRFYLLVMEQPAIRRYLVRGQTGRLGTKGRTSILYDGDSRHRANQILARKRSELLNEGYFHQADFERALSKVHQKEDVKAKPSSPRQGSGKKDAIVNPIFDRLHDPDPEVRQAAIRQIARAKPQWAANRLVEMLLDPVKTIRIEALDVLDNLRDASVAEKIMMAINNHNDTDLQQRAIGVARRLRALPKPEPKAQASGLYGCDACGRALGPSLHAKISAWARGDGGWDLHPALLTYLRVYCYACQESMGLLKRRYVWDEDDALRCIPVARY